MAFLAFAIQFPSFCIGSVPGSVTHPKVKCLSVVGWTSSVWTVRQAWCSLCGWALWCCLPAARASAHLGSRPWSLDPWISLLSALMIPVLTCSANHCDFSLRIRVEPRILCFSHRIISIRNDKKGRKPMAWILSLFVPFIRGSEIPQIDKFLEPVGCSQVTLGMWQDTAAKLKKLVQILLLLEGEEFTCVVAADVSSVDRQNLLFSVGGKPLMGMILLSHLKWETGMWHMTSMFPFVWEVHWRGKIM